MSLGAILGSSIGRLGATGFPGSRKLRLPNPLRLSDAQVRAVIAAAYAIDGDFGRFVEVVAVTGSRVSQSPALPSPTSGPTAVHRA